MSENNDIESVDYKYCSKCGGRFDINNFYKQGKNGRTSKCKQCVSATITENYKHRPTIFEQMTDDEKHNVCVGLLTGMLTRDIVKMTRMCQPTLTKLIKAGKFLDGVCFEYYDTDDDLISDTDEDEDRDELKDVEADGDYDYTRKLEEIEKSKKDEHAKKKEECVNLFLDLKRMNSCRRSTRSLKRRDATDELGEQLLPPKLTRQMGVEKIAGVAIPEKKETPQPEPEKVNKERKPRKKQEPKAQKVEPAPVIPVLPLSQLAVEVKKEPSKRGRPRKNCQ